MDGYDNLVYRIAFASLKGIKAAIARELLARVGSEENFFTATDGALTAILGRRSKIVERGYRDSVLDGARREADFVLSNRVRAIYFTDEAYPQRLLECDDAPVMLYVLGECDLNASHWIGMVGTRHATRYGCELTRSFVEELTRRLPQPPVIVSGLAFGIDIAAHRAALEAGAPTVAVLGHGLKTIYPALHRSSAASIIRSGGALLTDYRSDSVIHRGNFLARNRIVAGLCDALVVMESAEKGGAIVTARLAAGYSREVMAVPGRVSDTYSRGCNALIARNIAALVESADDVIDLMGWSVKETEPEQLDLFEELAPEEQCVIDLLTESGDMTIAALSARLEMSTPRLMSLLVDMEFRSLIMSVPGGTYRKC